VNAENQKVQVKNPHTRSIEKNFELVDDSLLLTKHAVDVDEMAHLDSEWIEGVYWVNQSICNGVLLFSFKGSKHSVPNDQNASIVLVYTVSVSA